MKRYKSNYINRALLTILCVFALNSEGVCMENLSLTEEETFVTHGRRITPMVLNYAAVLIGLAAPLSTDTNESVEIASAGISLGAVALNSVNWLVDQASIKGVTHKIFNGLVIVSGAVSAATGIRAATSTDPDEINLYSYLASVAGVSGLFFKGVDLFLHTSPADSKNIYEHLKSASLKIPV